MKYYVNIRNINLLWMLTWHFLQSRSTLRQSVPFFVVDWSENVLQATGFGKYFTQSCLDSIVCTRTLTSTCVKLTSGILAKLASSQYADYDQFSGTSQIVSFQASLRKASLSLLPWRFFPRDFSGSSLQRKRSSWMWCAACRPRPRSPGSRSEGSGRTPAAQISALK